MVVEVQHRLRLHGVVGLDTYGVEMPDDGVVLGGEVFQKMQGFLAKCLVFVELAIAEQQRDDGVDYQHVGGAFA